MKSSIFDCLQMPTKKEMLFEFGHRCECAKL